MSSEAIWSKYAPIGLGKLIGMMILYPGSAHRGVPFPYERRGTGEEPQRDGAVEDHAAERGTRHERPDRIAPEVMSDIPACMNQPADSDPPVRPQRAKPDRGA